MSGTASARRISRRALARKARAILRRIGLGGDELSIRLVRDPEIHALNRDWRGKDRPTDVLSFSLREGKFGDVSRALGDVVISLETAARQAAECRRSLADEVDRLLVHGILHLAGYDHEVSPREERRMRRKERELRGFLARSDRQ
ncbi:MAG: rRNA maturation RNase YbeY [Candidatus Binatia bacterium]